MRSIATPDEAQEGAGRMPAPQRARRPRYGRWIGLTFMSCTLLVFAVLRYGMNAGRIKAWQKN
jgi:hypothetical protein